MGCEELRKELHFFLSFSLCLFSFVVGVVGFLLSLDSRLDDVLRSKIPESISLRFQPNNTERTASLNNVLRFLGETLYFFQTPLLVAMRSGNQAVIRLLIKGARCEPEITFISPPRM